MRDYSGNPASPSPSATDAAAAPRAAGIDAEFACRFRDEVERELIERLLPFWMERALDRQGGGFFGQVGADGVPVPDAPKAGLLNARILWTFARAYRRYGTPAYLAMAQRAHGFLVERVRDRRHGGLFWTVDRAGNALEPHKQIYLQAFGIYGLAEYARATGDADALGQAIELHRLVERNARDRRHGGYVEAFERDWSPRPDVRLNPRFDPDVPKTMNTHLHLLEAYAGLARAWPDPTLTARLTDLVRLFVDRIVDSRTGHCRLYFGDDWEPRSDRVSFGHDIEAGWLLVAAARGLHDETLQAAVAPVAIGLARAVLAHGIDDDGGVRCEAGPGVVTVDHKDWWPQAEAVVGFLDAFELTGDAAFLRTAHRSWCFIREHVIDPAAGEWRWRVRRDGTSAGLPLVAKWKCPYHNGRMCLEVVRRLARLSASEHGHGYGQ